MTAVVRLSNEDESGDPITPDSQTGADADRGGDAARARTTCKVSQGHRGSRRLVRAGPVTGEWMRRGRYQNNRLGQILGRREGGESEQSFKSWRRERPSIIELAVAFALARHLCILGSAKEVVRRTATNFTCCWHAPRVQLGHSKFRKGGLIHVIDRQDFLKYCTSNFVAN